MPKLSRRSFLLLAASGGATLTAVPALAAPATARVRFSMIQVDVSALEQKNYGAMADWVHNDLNRALARLFPGRAGRAAPRLVVRIDSLSLGDYADSHDPGTDYLYGQALVVAPDRTILAAYPIRLSLPPNKSGLWYIPDIDRKRVRTLCRTFAGWVVRYVEGAPLR